LYVPSWSSIARRGLSPKAFLFKMLQCLRDFLAVLYSDGPLLLTVTNLMNIVLSPISMILRNYLQPKFTPRSSTYLTTTFLDRWNFAGVFASNVMH
jgi:hypothetical protein